MYAIMMQKAGKDEEVRIKELTKFAGEKEGQTVFFPIKFPCLKVVLGAANDDGRFAITWSHFYHEIKLGPNKGQPNVSEYPGKFKVKRVELRRPMLYAKDSNNRTMRGENGKPVFDFLAMASQWGTEATPGPRRQLVWSYGPNHPMLEDVIYEDEYESIDSLRTGLAERFGSDLADEVCLEFLSHELYQTYDLTFQSSGADAKLVAEASAAHKSAA